jgi:hypothetical protein
LYKYIKKPCNVKKEKNTNYSNSRQQNFGMVSIFTPKARALFKDGGLEKLILKH